MTRMIDLTGQKFSKLKVLSYAGKDKQGSALWLCRCECGKTKVIIGKDLRNGHTKSCGCYQKERVSITNRTHNQTNTRLYRTWRHMKDRCFYPKSDRYKNYGARGITVCNEWLNFENFYNWAINNGYKENLTLERRNNNGNYEPKNCCWILMKEQAKNKQNSKKYTYKNETKILSDWIRFFNTTEGKIRYRIKNWGVDKAFRTLERGI